METQVDDITTQAVTSRITSLDLVRGVAVLGILLMNAVSFGLGVPAYFNLDAGGMDSWADWVVGGFGEVFIDQKFMAVFSMLFGAGIVLFHERAVSKGRRAVGLSLWRNLLLLAIGLMHGYFWDGDVLFVYAVCAPLVILARRLSDRLLVILGVAAVILPTLIGLLAQGTVDSDGAGLGEIWGVPGEISDAVGIWVLADFFGRALGMMLIGIVLYRNGFITGKRPVALYRRVAWWGLGTGLASAGVGLAMVVSANFEPSVAIVGSIPNTLGTVPAATGIVAIILLWGARDTTRLSGRLQAVGRMALTNYLAHTALGLLVFDVLFSRSDPSRIVLLAFVGAVWCAQLWWSQLWLQHFRFGPAEWLWRTATYRTSQPFKQRRAAVGV